MQGVGLTFFYLEGRNKWGDMAKKFKGKNYDSPYGINLNGSQNNIALETESKTLLYERLLKEKDEQIKILRDEVLMLKSMLSIKQRWFPE